ncbi:hypothetical protein JL49_15725 [Pseudoalteromonas luteoviolacea]|nr:hypothetical protein JL49_15725 [Pseudoalteromonas luteoviolacea]
MLADMPKALSMLTSVGSLLLSDLIRSTMGDTEVELFLNHLVNQQDVSPNTQSQALNALNYLF